MYCRECNHNWPDDYENCPICAKPLRDPNNPDTGEWMLLGSVLDKVSSDFAREVLASYKIPAVVISRSGFFGNAGLTFNTFYKPGSSLFEVFVPGDHRQEAAGILKMALGDQWQEKDT
jgi:RNA polymerase subunit RPABC4/transcription elongation factor Spt4